MFLYGWCDFFEKQILDFNDDYKYVGRVICEERSLYRVQVNTNQSIWASISGKINFKAQERTDYPAVGDWVVLRADSFADKALITHVLKRKNVIFRKQIGGSADRQIIASNIDYAFITTSMNADLNIRRIERYLTVIYEAKVRPIILLTKSDLCLSAIDNKIIFIKSEFPGIEVFAVSKNNFSNIDSLSNYFAKGSTSVFIGSSGVGKSTIINYLIGNDEVKTQEVRLSDDKGRHTTTSRNIYESFIGGLILDTPGMRELQMSDHSDGFSMQFEDIENLTLQCRFTDCQHQSEPGCAVIAAIDSSELDIGRWNSYKKQISEIRYNQRRLDQRITVEEKKQWKKLTIEGRERGRSKRGLKRS